MCPAFDPPGWGPVPLLLPCSASLLVGEDAVDLHENAGYRVLPGLDLEQKPYRGRGAHRPAARGLRLVVVLDDPLDDLVQELVPVVLVHPEVGHRGRAHQVPDAVAHRALPGRHVDGAVRVAHEGQRAAALVLPVQEVLLARRGACLALPARRPRERAHAILAIARRVSSAAPSASVASEDASTAHVSATSAPAANASSSETSHSSIPLGENTHQPARLPGTGTSSGG